MEKQGQEPMSKEKNQYCSHHKSFSNSREDTAYRPPMKTNFKRLTFKILHIL